MKKLSEVKSPEEMKSYIESRNGLMPLKAIKAKCYDCCAYNSNEVKLCSSETCPLWVYRFGNSRLRKQLYKSEPIIDEISDENSDDMSEESEE